MPRFETYDPIAQKLGSLIDKTETYLTYRDANLTPQLKTDALLHGIQELRTELKALYFELGGEDLWDLP